MITGCWTPPTGGSESVPNGLQFQTPCCGKKRELSGWGRESCFSSFYSGNVGVGVVCVWGGFCFPCRLVPRRCPNHGHHMLGIDGNKSPCG